jgi:segregation and condensation protein B
MKLENASKMDSTNDFLLDTTFSHPAQLVIPGAEPGHGRSDDQIAHMISAMLFVAHESPTVNELAAGAELAPADIERGLEILASQDRGLVIQRHGNRVSLATSPRFARQIRQFLGLDRDAKLSSPALETLAIIAYRQPVTRAEIEAVRGVDCSGVIATLHARALIEPVSRRTTVGNPIQYGTTGAFLNHFGLVSLADLPMLGTINGQNGQDVLASAVQSAEEVGDRDGDHRDSSDHDIETRL